jgi:galacturonokinase
MTIPIKEPSARETCIDLLRDRYAALYPSDPTLPYFLVRVPLRLAPLGAHSDHQGGTVTGFTIDRFIHLFGQLVHSPEISVASMNFDRQSSVLFESIPPSIPGDWCNYARGAVSALQTSFGKLSNGFRGVVFGEMPIGGLSSSAAVTLAYLAALEHVNHIKLTPLERIMHVRAVENGYLGLHNGILDQSVIVSSVEGALTVIDCSKHSIASVAQRQSQVPWEILVVYSGLSRQLTATPFNQRVAECREAARELLDLLGRTPSDVPRLGEVTYDEYRRLEDKLSAVSRKRARHFFSEAARVKEGVQLWEAGDMQRFGELVTQSGNSSIVNYESGSPALISLYEILSGISGVYGTRFCGGGFQGCSLALIDPRKRYAVVEQLHEQYAARHPEVIPEYSVHLCSTSNSISLEVIP